MSKDLSSQIAQLLADYSEEVEERLDQETDLVAEKAVEMLKTTSPKRLGKYAKNWTKKKTSSGHVVIYNKAPTYRLTHLLERSHLLRNGGRSQAQPHIAPVEDLVIEEMTQRIKKVVKG